MLGVATRSEFERMVVYRPLYNDGGWWVRPLEMFLETVTHKSRHYRFARMVG